MSFRGKMAKRPTCLTAALLLSALLSLAFGTVALAGPPDVAGLTARLDDASGAADINKAATALEALTSGAQAPPGSLTQLGRAYYLMGESEKDKARRLSCFDRSLGASESALKANPADLHALYWRSIARLQKADLVGGLTALKLVKGALRDLDTVSAKDPLYDGAGADRLRGKVLMDAPSWAFIGDKNKGVILLECAAKRAPNLLINRFYLADAYACVGRDKEAVSEISFIMAAPVDKKKPADDLEVKGDAGKLLKKLTGR